ncbi:hypothetical protein [Nostoc flagelliforme]|uniref:hypothetical protein n=1 Tax=Nostoc flagelliforme TaxID=1306274 RepID=UPI0012FDE07F|nr:hypothetical protein [Nostoc flagelliforme]
MQHQKIDLTTSVQLNYAIALIHTLTGLGHSTANMLITSLTFLYLQLNILIMIPTAINN